MNIFKHFLAGVMNVSLRNPYLILNEPVAVNPTLLNYVKFLHELKYMDGKCHTYFGEIKKLVHSFVTFWTETMDEALKDGDRLSNTTMDKPALEDYVQKAIDRYTNLFTVFEKEFLPIDSPEQQQIYDDILKKRNSHTEALHEMKAMVEKIDRPHQVDAFLKSEIPKSVNMKNEIFRYAHTYISMLLADHLAEIEGSLKDILQRLRKNIATQQEETDQELYSLFLQLYEKNKEHMMFNRREERPSAEAAEIRLAIEKMRQRVIEHGYEGPMALLAEEEQYFDARLKEFQQIADTLRKVKAELEVVEREYAIYKSMSSTELPSSKLTTWEIMRRSYEKRSETVKDSLIKAAKALLTFFCVRGPSYALYADSVGPYYIDELGHQVYRFASGLKTYHVDCNRNFKEVEHKQRYYYDNVGRYWYDKGKKVYQVQECGSTYQLGEDSLLKKMTVDCGHSETENKGCGMKIKDLTVGVMLPEADPVDITRTLDAEVTHYLWDVVGGILPDALHDVGVLQPKNPIHYLAHRLLAHKYGQSKAELRRKKEEADAYRANIMKERKEKVVAETREWKAKLMPRRKPEDFDDAEERAAFDARLATRDLIYSINFYD